MRKKGKLILSASQIWTVYKTLKVSLSTVPLPYSDDYDESAETMYIVTFIL